MAFENLFTGLFVVNEDEKSLKEPVVSHRNNSEDGKRHRKRKNQGGGQRGPVNKRPCSQNQNQNQKETRRNSDISDKDNGDVSLGGNVRTSKGGASGLTEEMTPSRNDRRERNRIYNKGRNYRNVNNRREQRKEPESGGRHKEEGGSCRGGSRRGRGAGKPKHVRPVKAAKPMTEEFKEQNAVTVDGQLVCRHFLYGRCIKGDECQLRHVQGHNDCIKKVCKFYVQGFCTKGQSCPYMHKSFPCKFFHRKGECLHGENCMFSHQPLDETTTMLLEEALKRDNDLRELATKAEQESLRQPANTDEPGVTDTMVTTDVVIATLRPNFYCSRETSREQEAVSSETETREVSDTALPAGGASVACAHLQSEEPVCYSVEAVLGPRLYRPFPSFSTTPVGQDSSAHGPSTWDVKSQAPCSVDTVLSSKSGRRLLSGISSPATTQRLSCSPPGGCKVLPQPLPGSETRYSVSCTNESMEPREETSDILKMQPEKEEGAGAKSFPLSAPAPESESLRGHLQRRLPGHVLPPARVCRRAAFLSFSPTHCKGQTLTSAHPSQSGLHPSGPLLDSEASGLSHMTCRPAEPVEQPTGAQRLSEEPQSDLRPGNDSTQPPAVNSSETVGSGAGTRKKLFSCLFSNSITGDHRTSRETEPDRTPRKTEPDWTSRETEPDRTPRETEPDRTSRETEPNWTFKETEPYRTSRETEPNWTFKETEPDWTSRETEPDRTFKETEPNWTSKETEPNWTSKETEPNWTSRETEPNRTSKETETDRTSRETEPDWTSRETETDRTSRETEPDWTSKETEPDRTSKETEPYRTSRETEPNWTSKETEPDRTPRETEPDWTSKETEPDWTSRETEPYRTFKETEPNWTSKETEPNWTSRETEPNWTSKETETDRTSRETEPNWTSRETETDRTSTRSFLGLFTSLRDTSETSLQMKQSSTTFKLFATSTSPSPSGGPDHSRAQTQRFPFVSSAEVSTSPDLKTLFLSLRPYKADEERHDDVATDMVKVQSSVQCLSAQHQTKTKKRKKKRQRSERHQRERSPSPSETTPSCVEQTRGQETKPETQNLLFRPVAHPVTGPLRQSQVRQTQASQGQRVEESTVVTPIKNLFSSFDFGQKT